MTPPARVEITAPAGARPSFGKAQCEDQVKDRFLDVLVPPRRLVFDVARFGYYVCYVEGHVASTAGTAPPTDTLRDVAHEESSGSGMFLAALAALAAFGASLLVGMRRRRWHRPGPYQIRQQPWALLAAPVGRAKLALGKRIASRGPEPRPWQATARASLPRLDEASVCVPPTGPAYRGLIAGRRPRTFDNDPRGGALGQHR